MYSQFQNNNSQMKSFSSAGSMTSQFANNQQKYQPVGYVQSQYTGQANSIANNRFASQYQPQAQTQTYVQSQYQPQSQFQNQYQPQFTQSSQFHTANYRGNQQGHDAVLRNEFQGQSQFGSAAASNSFINQYNQPSYQQSFQPSYQSASSFHLPNYRGNQQDHDFNSVTNNSYSSGASSFQTGGAQNSFNMR